MPVDGSLNQRPSVQPAGCRQFVSPFTDACVPTGMNTGVSISPARILSTPRRARPSRAVIFNDNKDSPYVAANR